MSGALPLRKAMVGARRPEIGTVPRLLVIPWASPRRRCAPVAERPRAAKVLSAEARATKWHVAHAPLRLSGELATAGSDDAHA